ncbi:hypothetical protein B0H11DRAFT_2244742 [Mycena galericulata]|nr:hypothetical protein B0H11DRAFT_2244742 [Mycena galericulata]
MSPADQAFAFAIFWAKFAIKHHLVPGRLYFRWWFSASARSPFDSTVPHPRNTQLDSTTLTIYMRSPDGLLLPLSLSPLHRSNIQTAASSRLEPSHIPATSAHIHTTSANSILFSKHNIDSPHLALDFTQRTDFMRSFYNLSDSSRLNFLVCPLLAPHSENFDRLRLSIALHWPMPSSRIGFLPPP